MIYQVVLEPRAQEHLRKHIKAGNKILIEKIKRLLEELKQNPRLGTGKPKPLKHDRAGVWSRRIDEKHRMLYTIEDDRVIVFVIALWGHYEDK